MGIITDHSHSASSHVTAVQKKTFFFKYLFLFHTNDVRRIKCCIFTAFKVLLKFFFKLKHKQIYQGAISHQHQFQTYRSIFTVLESIRCSICTITIYSNSSLGHCSLLSKHCIVRVQASLFYTRR